MTEPVQPTSGEAALYRAVCAEFPCLLDLPGGEPIPLDHWDMLLLLAAFEDELGHELPGVTAAPTLEALAAAGDNICSQLLDSRRDSRQYLTSVGRAVRPLHPATAYRKIT